MRAMSTAKSCGSRTGCDVAPGEFLPDKRDAAQCPVNIMVGRIASRNIFESKLLAKLRIAGYSGSCVSYVRSCSKQKFANKCFDYDQRRIEHQRIGRTIFDRRCW